MAFFYACQTITYPRRRAVDTTSRVILSFLPTFCYCPHPSMVNSRPLLPSLLPIIRYNVCLLMLNSCARASLFTPVAALALVVSGDRAVVVFFPSILYSGRSDPPGVGVTQGLRCVIERSEISTKIYRGDY